MKVKTTVILFGIFIILLVFVYLIEGPLSQRERKKAKEVTALFPDFDKTSAVTIEVKGPSQQASLEKKEEEWIINNTNGFTADPPSVNAALDAVKNFTRENIASKKAEKQGLFEVTREKGVEVKVSDANQKLLAHFYIGKTGPDFFSSYLRKEGSDEVILANGSLRGIFDKSTKNWRDKTIFDIPAHAIIQLTLITPTHEIVLAKDEQGNWQITSPEKAKAKKEEVEAMVNTFASLKALDFAEDENLEKYQLDTPQTTIKAIVEGKEEKQLLIGKKHEEKSHYYVKNQSKKTIFLVGKYQVDKMTKTVQDLKEEEKKEEATKAEETKSEPKKQEALTPSQPAPPTS